MALSVFAIISIICITLMVIIQVLLVSFLIVALRKLALRMREKIAPIAVKANLTLNVINNKIEIAQSTTEQFSDSVENMAFSLNTGLSRLASLTQFTVAIPIIAFTAISEGFKRGFASWKETRLLRTRLKSANR